MKKNLTDRTLKSLKPAVDSKPYEVMDSLVPSFGVRVMGKPDAPPVRSFILVKRFPGSNNPTRRTLGTYGELSLEQAREKARSWLDMIARGIDPAVEIERLRKAELEAGKHRQAYTFGTAFEAYLKHKAKLRSRPAIEREMRREFAAWMTRPLSDVTTDDVVAAIQDIKDRGAETQAHTLYAMLRGFLNWTVNSRKFQLKISPCAGIKPKDVIGERNIGSRVLKDYEIAAYWRAADGLGYPFGPFLKLLLLTALRRNEAAGARWDEIDFNPKIWIVPEGRMKGKEGKAVPHAVPLTDEVIVLLNSLPRFRGGDFLFSTTGGRRPVSGFSKAKARLDAAMRADLEAQGRAFESFTIHDIRRTCRTKFSALADVADVTCEALLAHVQPGIRKAYNFYKYEPEKREALEKWHAKLRAIVEPRPDNVIKLELAAASA